MDTALKSFQIATVPKPAEYAVKPPHPNLCVSHRNVTIYSHHFLIQTSIENFSIVIFKYSAELSRRLMNTSLIQTSSFIAYATHTQFCCHYNSGVGISISVYALTLLALLFSLGICRD